MRLAGIVLSIVGLVGIIFGVIWVTAVFPRYQKIPSDFSRTDEFEGTYTVMDPFIQQVQQSPAVQQLRGSPTTLALLANPDVQQLISNPQALQLLTDPQVQAILANPAAAMQSTDPAVQQVLANPIIQQLVANPTLLQALASPTVQRLMANPSALQLLLNPAAQGVLANPAVPGLLADPAIQQLLADPTSLQLVIDPRTMQLLADPTAIPVIEVPVLIHRERVATGTDGDRIFINEQVTTTMADTGDELAGFPKTNLDMVVDRGDKVYLEGTEGGRTGGLAFPFGVKKDAVYPTWVSAARQPLDASYASTEQVQGPGIYGGADIEVYVFEIREQDLPMPALAGDPGPLVVDSGITIRVEPRSGRVVDIEDHSTTVSLLNATGKKSAVFVSDIEYTQETVDTQIEEAMNDKDDLVFYGTTLPGLTIGLGILLIILGALAFLRSRRTGAAT